MVTGKRGLTNDCPTNLGENSMEKVFTHFLFKFHLAEIAVAISTGILATKFC